MKNLIAVLSLFACVITSSSQNWSPILIDQKMNYRHSDSAYITNTIWVDSTKIIGGIFFYFLNHVVKNIPDNPEIVLRNQSQFFYNKVQPIQGGIYLFAGEDSFQFFSLTGVGETWLLGTQNSLWATVDSIQMEDVFGVPDSVKYIHLSDSTEIWLSKSFGILRFPDLDNGGYYELVGIQGTQNGESVPGFWEIFDFEVGDVFQYSIYGSDPSGSGALIRKISILTKEIGSSSVTYHYYGIDHPLYSNKDDNKGISSSSYYADVTYVDSTGHPANFFTHQLFRLPNTGTILGTGKTFTRARIETDTLFLQIVKKFGAKNQNSILYGADDYYELNQNSDTLYRFPWVVTYSDPCGIKGVGYGNHIGEIFKTESCFEYDLEKDLVGYVKDGDTVGIITPDSVLLSASSSKKISPKNDAVQVYPNPAVDVLNIHILKFDPGKQYNIELRNSMGNLVHNYEIIKSQGTKLDISNLPSGLYFYSVKSGEETVQNGKLIIR